MELPTIFSCEAFTEVRKSNVDHNSIIADTASRLGVDEDIAKDYLEANNLLVGSNDDEIFYEYFPVTFDLKDITRVEGYIIDDETTLCTAICDNPQYFYHLNVDYQAFVEAWVKAKTGTDNILMYRNISKEPNN